jgi:uncharacterized protein
VDTANLDRHLHGVDAVLDCTDNLPARFLLHDGCRRAGVPLFHAALSGYQAVLQSFLPGGDAGCLRCQWPGGAPETCADDCRETGMFGYVAALAGVPSRGCAACAAPTARCAPMAALSLLFFLLAGLYASVGFAGGSVYTAVLAVTGLDARDIAFTALLCNAAASLAGSVTRWRAGQRPPAAAFWLTAASVPAAFAGGMARLSAGVYFLLLGAALAAAALSLWRQPDRQASGEPCRVRAPRAWVLAAVGVVIGGLSGLVGIGGGVFLAPIAHRARWDEAGRLAAWFSGFILLNSLAGLAGQAARPGELPWRAGHAALVMAVLAGGALGASLGRRRLPPRRLLRLTALIVFTAALQCLWRGARHG